MTFCDTVLVHWSTLSIYYLILSSWSQQYFELLCCTLLWMYYNLGRECTCWELGVVLFSFPMWNVWWSILESCLWIHRLNSANNMAGGRGSQPWVLGTLIYEAVLVERGRRLVWASPSLSPLSPRFFYLSPFNSVAKKKKLFYKLN